MHFCGNPFHDVLFYLALTLPFLAGLLGWCRAWLGARLGAHQCRCGHEHEAPKTGEHFAQQAEDMVPGLKQAEAASARRVPENRR